MDVRDKIIELIRVKGPVIPAQISKEISSDIIITSAYLSELVNHKKLRISKLKVGGGSPLYFLPGQEPKLQDFSDNLNEKDRRAFEHLKEHKVVRDSDLSPLMRVSLREIKDFAKPLEVMLKESKEIFWKWYTLDTNECTDMIRQILDGSISESGQENKLKETEPEAEAKEKDKEEVEETEADDEIKEKESKEKIIEKDGAEETPDGFNEILKETEKDEQKQEKSEKEKVIGVQQTLVKKEEIQQSKSTFDNEELLDYARIWDDADSKFIQKLKDYFKMKNIGLVEVKINRKNTDIEFTLNIESSIGKMLYFCKAKNKKKVTDGDLSSAYMLGQASKLPTVLIMTGEMTKKAKEMLTTQLKGLTVVKI
ncbi:MAG: hypothetical protein U9R34_02930 [Nanoarchaeota archaeon]|nr:hypothetical protein [Nanoarchaeota archaeon]